MYVREVRKAVGVCILGQFLLLISSSTSYLVNVPKYLAFASTCSDIPEHTMASICSAIFAF